MKKQRSLGNGLALIILGTLLLLLQLLPQRFTEQLDLGQQWPLILVAVGALQFIGALTGNPARAVPALVVAGLGGMMLAMNVTGNWGSWRYAWTLIPVFAGTGQIIAGLLGHRRQQSVARGLRQAAFGLVALAIFGTFFGAWQLDIDLVGPVLLIAGGLWLLATHAWRGP